jgi:hypothetical protein
VVLLVVPALENCGVLYARRDSGPSAWPAVVVRLPLQNSASAGWITYGGPMFAPRDISAISTRRTGEQLPNPPGIAARISLHGHPSP